MSHITKVAGTVIRDVNALKSAVQDLKAKGIMCELVQNAKVRMHHQSETEQVGVCDYVLKLNGGQYDVGFKKQADGTYQPVMDTYGNHVGGQIGAKCPLPNTAEGRAQHQMGQFLQNYSKHAAINAARAKGHQVQSATYDKQGNLQLTLVGYN